MKNHSRLSRRKQPLPLTGHRLKEWREFEQRKAEEVASLTMATELAAKVKIRSRQFPVKADKRIWTPRGKIAKAFKPGYGRLS